MSIRAGRCIWSVFSRTDYNKLWKSKKVSSLLNKKAIMMLYNSLIISYLTYCISSWYFGNTALINKLQCSVNKFIRLIYKLIYGASVIYIMKKTKQCQLKSYLNLRLQTLCIDILITCYRMYLDIFLIKAYQTAILETVQMLFQNTVG